MRSTKQTSERSLIRQRRSRTRGAVLAEASIVLVTLALFSGAIGFLHSALAAKIDVQQHSRESAFQSATKHCDGGEGPADGSLDENASFAAADLPIEGLAGDSADMLGTALQIASPITYGAAHAQASRSVSGSMASRDDQGVVSKSPLSVSVTGNSWAMCTPRPIDGNLDAVQYGTEFMAHKANDIVSVLTKVIGAVKDKIVEWVGGFF